MEQKAPNKSIEPWNGFGARIREERQRLKLNQSEFAALAGVSRGAQAHYELEQRVPDLKYLAALHGEVDVPYLITGERISQQAGGQLDPKVLESVLTAIDLWVKETGRVLSNATRAELVVLFVQQAMSTGKIEGEWMRRTLKLVK